MPENNNIEGKKGMSVWVKLGLILGGLIILIIIIAVNSGGEDKDQETTTSTVAETKTETPAATPTPSYTFDVPSLVGKNIDEVRQIIGVPLDQDMEPSAQQSSLGVDEWYNSYKKGDQDLLVTFNSKSRKIIDFFLSGDNKNKLLETGNLKGDDSRYIIEPVTENRNPSAISGIKIIPKQ